MIVVLFFTIHSTFHLLNYCLFFVDHLKLILVSSRSLLRLYLIFFLVAGCFRYKSNDNKLS